MIFRVQSVCGVETVRRNANAKITRPVTPSMDTATAQEAGLENTARKNALRVLMDRIAWKHAAVKTGIVIIYLESASVIQDLLGHYVKITVPLEPMATTANRNVLVKTAARVTRLQETVSVKQDGRDKCVLTGALSGSGGAIARSLVTATMEPLAITSMVLVSASLALKEIGVWIPAQTVNGV